MLLDQFFAQIENQFNAKVPFVAYRKPNDFALKAMLQEDCEITPINDFTESGFVFAPFDSRKEAYLIPLAKSKLLSATFNGNGFSEVEETDWRTSSYAIDPSQKENKISHISLVENGIAAIENDCFSKVVLSRREVLENAEIKPIEVFKRLLKRYPTAFVYVWYHPELGLWLGATPETLLSVSGNQLKTMSLAGTQSFEGSTHVFWKDKEKEEQKIVTDFIVESLESIGSLQRNSSDTLNEGLASVNTTIKVSEAKTVQAGNLLHLQTEITMQLSPETMNLKPILDALHPTPAVCGFPKEKAKAYIVENEGYSREFYSGFLGELNLKETINRNTNRRNVENNAYSVQKSVSNLYVNLRCMQIKNNNVFIYIGGGVTKDSVAQSEWEETVQKSKIIKSVL